jgi:hypothetical protein
MTQLSRTFSVSQPFLSVNATLWPKTARAATSTGISSRYFYRLFPTFFARPPSASVVAPQTATRILRLTNTKRVSQSYCSAEAINNPADGGYSSVG